MYLSLNLLYTLQNNLHELWALLNFLLPDVFGSAGSFRKPSAILSLQVFSCFRANFAAAFDSWFNLASDAADEAAKEATVNSKHS